MKKKKKSKGLNPEDKLTTIIIKIKNSSEILSGMKKIQKT